MFLSRVSMQPSAQAKQAQMKLAANGVYSSHQLMWQLFRGQSERQFLYREEKSINNKPTFYVLSQYQPIDGDGIFNVETKLFAPKLYTGQQLGFCLRANPTISVKNMHGKSQRHDVMMHTKKKAKEDGVEDTLALRKLMDQAAQQWLANEKRLQEWGIRLNTLPTIRQYQKHRTSKSKSKTITFSSVDMQGTLTVEETERFIQNLARGFGRAKSMGCGLMLIRPV